MKLLQRLVAGSVTGFGFAAGVTIFFSLWAFLSPVPMRSPFSLSKPSSEISDSTTPTTPREFLLQHESRMTIPADGGVFGVAILGGESAAKRPDTIQYWLTETALWEIRTADVEPHFRELLYPTANPVDRVWELLKSNSDLGETQLSTVSAVELSQLREGRMTRHHELNGSLYISNNGVMYLIPNEYGT